jgi:hypothetical protein
LIGSGSRRGVNFVQNLGDREDESKCGRKQHVQGSDLMIEDRFEVQTQRSLSNGGLFDI